MSLRVLVVARAYPSFDAPGRGSFVHDHVVALQAAGADPIVASFETIQVRGDDDRRKARAARAEVAWSAALADPAACNAGPRLGAPRAPVARLPVIRTWGALDGSEVPEMAARHAAPLLAFGRALATRSAAAGRPIDVIHAHNGLPDGVAALSLAAELGVPLVVTEHDSTLRDRLRRPEAAAVYRELLRHARVVAVSQAQADRVTAALSDHGEPVPVPLAIVPNAVPLDHFPPARQLRRDARPAAVGRRPLGAQGDRHAPAGHGRRAWPAAVPAPAVDRQRHQRRGRPMAGLGRRARDPRRSLLRAGRHAQRRRPGDAAGRDLRPSEPLRDVRHGRRRGAGVRPSGRGHAVGWGRGDRGTGRALRGDRRPTRRRTPWPTRSCGSAIGSR